LKLAIRSITSEMFKVPKFCFKTSGFASQTVFCRIIQRFLVSCVVFGGFSELLFIIKHRDDLIEAADAFATLVTAILSVVKMLTFFFKQQKFHELEAKIKKLNDEG
jgi:hypothetical protein